MAEAEERHHFSGNTAPLKGRNSLTEEECRAGFDLVPASWAERHPRLFEGIIGGLGAVATFGAIGYIANEEGPGKVHYSAEESTGNTRRIPVELGRALAGLHEVQAVKSTTLVTLDLKTR